MDTCTGLDTVLLVSPHGHRDVDLNLPRSIVDPVEIQAHERDVGEILGELESSSAPKPSKGQWTQNLSRL